MYKIEYLPIAVQDMVEISTYIAKELNNPTAAENLADKMINSIERLAEFPYINAVYNPIRPLKNEYRRLTVDNYVVFYTVDEMQKIVTIHRAIYGKRDYNKILSD